VNYVTVEDWIVVQINPQPDAAQPPSAPPSAPAGQIARSEAQPAQPAPQSQPATRTWTSADGKYSVKATLVSTTADAVTLKRAEDGLVVTVPMSRLSEADRGAAGR